jgi:threonine/homoserine/homoserine lactone efflux protein
MVVHLTAFLGVAVLVIVTPGPDTALTIRNTLMGGRPAGFATALGVSLGQATWALAASVGLAALVSASQPAFLALRLVGAAYLVWLGIQALLVAFGRHGGELGGVDVRGSRSLAPRAAFRQGILSNLGNPKMAVFFTSLLPQFVAPGGSAFAGFLLLGLLLSVMTLVWLSAYAIAVARAGDVLRRPRVRRTVEGITGAALVALGLRLATERRAL